MKAVKKFRIDTKDFSAKEKTLLKKLTLAAELIEPIYSVQKNEKYPGANFYPHDATKKEIEKAAKKNPLILDPYTCVERDEKGKLIAIPYHIKFKKELEPIVKLMREAAKLSKDKIFAKCLENQAQALTIGSYKKNNILLLQCKILKISFIAGPIEWYLDKLFAKKYSYQAWVGILDKEKTIEARKILTMVSSIQRKFLPGSKKINVLKTSVRIDKTIVLSGLIAEILISGMSLPGDAHLAKKHGSELTIFEPVLKARFKKDYFLIFKEIFNKKFQKSYSTKSLLNGAFHYTLLNEFSYSLIHYEDAEKRLGNLFHIFNEFLANILTIKIWEMLFLKGIITQKELETIFIFYLCRNFSLGKISLKKPDISFHYRTRAAITLNFLSKAGAIKKELKKKNTYLLNFTKLSICIHQLARLVEYHLALGNYKKAEAFVKKYSSPKIFQKFFD